MEKTLYLYEIASEYPTNTVIYILDNGNKVFNGVVGCISKYMSAYNLARKVNVYVRSDYTLVAYLQR